MAFVKVDSSKRSARLHVNEISIRVASMSFCSEFIGGLKQGDSVEIYIDEQERKIGIKKVEDRGFKVMKGTKKTLSIHCSQILKDIENKRYLVTKEEDMLVFRFDWKPANGVTHG